MAKRVNPKKLDDIRQQYKALQAEANARVSQLIEAGVQDYSRAYNDAVAKLGSYRTDDTNVFDVYDTRRFREIKREVALMEKFLNDKTSNVDDVRLQMAQGKYSGAFSGGWNKLYGVSYDKSRITEDEAKVAFSIYRRLEESGTSYETILGKSGYGSENLIMLIYDMVVQSGITDYDNESVEYWSQYGDIMEKAEDIIEEKFKERDAFAQEMRETGNEDTGLLFDLMRKSPSAFEWKINSNF